MELSWYAWHLGVYSMNLEKGLILNHWWLLWLLFRKKPRLAHYNYVVRLKYPV
jgi:hypothetical protein